MDILAVYKTRLMSIGDNIRKIREKKGILQKQLALEVDIQYTSYNKIEKGTRDVTVAELEKIAKYFGMTIDQVVNFDKTPVDIVIKDKPNFEKLQLINQLDDEDKNTVFKIIDTMLTKKKFKEFFKENINE